MVDFPQSLDVTSPWTVLFPLSGRRRMELLFTKNGSVETGVNALFVLVAATEKLMPSKLCNPKSGL
jgi:hypothetical protein